MSEESISEKFLHISTNVEVTTGSEAAARLRTENDAAYVAQTGGVRRVPIERWKQAQDAEAHHWFAAHESTADDRNYDHFQQFAGYAAIRGLAFTRAVELGSGPFTNLRLISRIAHIDKCVLVDPLIERYLDHPGTFLSTTALVQAPLDRRFPILDRRLPIIWRRLARAIGWTIPIEGRHALPAEEFTTDRPFDLTVMINVLEHCFDAGRAVRSMLDATRSGGYVIFADTVYDGEEVRRLSQRLFDAAHPLRITDADIAPVLDELELLHRCEVAAPAGLYERSRDVFFIGRKR